MLNVSGWDVVVVHVDEEDDIVVVVVVGSCAKYLSFIFLIFFVKIV